VLRDTGVTLPFSPPHLSHRIDILIDDKLKPWLLEINFTPSFSTGSKLDHKIKCGVVADALRLIDVSHKNK
jgi:tubulin polyglutamylase TTLL6/13